MRHRAAVPALIAFVMSHACVAAQSADPASGTYPQRPIRMIVPYPAGGPTDIVARTLAQRLTDALGQQVVVDNRGGANGVIAQEIAAKSAPDGYTIFVHSVAYVVNPLLYKVAYDNERDFVPVTLVEAFPLMLVAHPSLPVTSVKDLITLAKAKPGQLNYSSYGQGSIAQLAAEMLKNAAGVDIVHVVYKSAPQGLSAAIANEVQLSFPSVATGFPQVKAGRLKGLAVTSRARTPLIPDTPTMIEAGIPGFEATSWLGTFFQCGTPKAIVDRVHAETVKIVRIPEVKAGFESQGFEVIGAGPEEFHRFIRSEQRKYAQVVKAAKIHVE
jgi:tripartite-type tricarboxylate transporter receptor subunit TctC